MEHKMNYRKFLQQVIEVTGDSRAGASGDLPGVNHTADERQRLQATCSINPTDLYEQWKGLVRAA